jgi:hypothetical protein
MPRQCEPELDVLCAAHDPPARWSVGTESATCLDRCQAPVDGTPGTEHDADPLQAQAAKLFAEQLAADRVPWCAIRAQFHVGQPRAQRLRDYLAAGAARRVESRAA